MYTLRTGIQSCVIQTCGSIVACKSVCVCVCVCVCVRAYVCNCVCMYVCVCIYTYVYACTYVCMYRVMQVDARIHSWRSYAQADLYTKLAIWSVIVHKRVSRLDIFELH